MERADVVFVVDVGNDVAQDAIPNLKHFIMSTLIVMELGKDKIRVTAVYVGLNHTINSLLVDWKLTVLSFRFPVHFFQKPICPINVTFFYTVHLFYEYVQSNQSNTRDRKNLRNTSKLFSNLFYSLVNKKSIIMLIGYPLRKSCGAARSPSINVQLRQSLLLLLRHVKIT